MKRIFEYTQAMYIEQPMLFSHCMKTALKIVDTDLTYSHAEELYEQFKGIDLETDLERFVLPGYGSSRYKDNPNISKKRYEALHMPDFDAQVLAEGLTGEEARNRKKQLVKQWRKQHALVSYYIPKYNWSLATYIKWFRKNGVTMNYKEVDTLRK